MILKELFWVGSAKEDLKNMPKAVQQEIDLIKGRFVIAKEMANKQH